MANNREDRGENKEEIKEDRGEGTKTIKEEIEVNKEELRRDISNLIEEIKKELGSNVNSIPFIPNITWQDIIGIVAPNPSQHVLTKEDLERINAAIVAKMYVLDYNLHEYLAQLSTDRCMLERLIIFFIIKKIAPQLLQWKLNRMNSIIQSIQAQAQMYQSVIGLLQTAVTTIPSLIITDIKWDAIVATGIAALIAIGTEIGNLKNNLRALINDNEFCIRGCSSACAGSPPISLANTPPLLKTEGDIFKERAEEIWSRLLELMDLEFELIEKQKDNLKLQG